MHLNKAVIVGKVTSAKPKLTYPAEKGHPTVTFWVQIDEPSPGGKVYSSYIPVEITSKLSEEIAASLDPGDEIMVDGKLKYRSAGLTKDGKKAGGVVVTSWYITKAQSNSTPAVQSQN